jgi:hypothetical protein
MRIQHKYSQDMPDLNPQPLESQTAFATQPNRLVTLLMQPAAPHRVPSTRLNITFNNICIHLALNVLEWAFGQGGKAGRKTN